MYPDYSHTQLAPPPGWPLTIFFPVLPLVPPAGMLTDLSPELQ